MEEVLRTNSLTISQKLANLDDLLIALFSEGIISETEIQAVQARKTSNKKNFHLLLLIRKKSVKKMVHFVKMLEKTGNEDIAVDIKATAKERDMEHLFELNYCNTLNTISNSTDESQQSTSKKRNEDREDYPSTQQKVRKIERLLAEIWWPEEKVMINSFHERSQGDQLIVEKLYAILQQSANNSTVITQDKCVVSGLGGIGKTSIAKWFAHYYEKQYDYIFWINCGEGSLSESFKTLAIDLKIENWSELGLETRAIKCFSKLQDFKCLIIFDNAECLVGNEGILNVLPKKKNNNLHVIITSRNQDWGEEGAYGKIETFSLDVFSDVESTNFLQKALNDKNISNSLLNTLGKLLGHLPLALQIAVATLNKQKLAMAEYIQQLVSHDEEIINLRFDDYEKTINKTMKISLKQIKENEAIGEDAFNVLVIFGYIQPDDVEYRFFQNVGSFKNPKMRTAVTLLEQYSLVTTEKKHKGSNKTPTEYISIHRLLQQVIRHNGKATENETLRKILNCKGHINYKLIPYTYAEKYEDLKIEFSFIKVQLIQQLKLAELHSARQYNEAASLSLIIHESFDRIESKKKYLKSKFNYALCLASNGQLKRANDIFENYCEEIESSHFRRSFVSKGKGNRWSIIHRSDSFELGLLSLTRNEFMPTRDIIDCYSNFIQEHNSIEECFEKLVGNRIPEMNISYGDKHDVDNNVVDELLLMLHLGLIAACKTPSSLISLKNVAEKIFAFMEKQKINYFRIDFTRWLLIFENIEKLFSESYSCKKGRTTDVQLFTQLLALAGILLSHVDIEKTHSSSNQLGQKLFNIIQSNKESQILFFPDLFFIREYIFGPDDTILKEIMTLEINEVIEDNTQDAFTTNFSDGEFFCQGKFGAIKMAEIITTPQPTLLTQLTFRQMTILMPEFLIFLAECVNVTQIILQKIRFHGVYENKVQMPNLKYFELELYNNNELLDTEIIDYYTFFSVHNSPVWESVSSLESYKLKSYSNSTERNSVKLDKNSKCIVFNGIFLTKRFLSNSCTKVIWVDCKGDINEVDRVVYSNFRRDRGNSNGQSIGNYSDGTISLSGEGIVNNVFKFLEAQILTTLILQGVTVELQQLITSLTHHSINIVKIDLDNIVIIRDCTEKVHLPRLKHFSLQLEKDEKLGVAETEYYSLFVTKDMCIWKSISNLEYYMVKYNSSSVEYYESTLKLLGMSIPAEIPLYIFLKIQFTNCEIEYCPQYNQICTCINCMKFEMEPSPSLNISICNTDSSNALLNSLFVPISITKTQNIIIDNTRFYYILDNERVLISEEYQYQLTLNKFLNGFSNLKHLTVKNVHQNINVLELVNVETIDLGNTKLGTAVIGNVEAGNSKLGNDNNTSFNSNDLDLTEFSNIEMAPSKNLKNSIPKKSLLSSLNLENVNVDIKYLISALSSCKNLNKLTLNISLQGQASELVHLPALRYFKSKFNYNINLDVNMIERLVFFHKTHLCLWSTINELEYFKIESRHQYLEFDLNKHCLSLSLSEISVEKQLPWHLFTALDLRGCVVLVDSEEVKVCSCTNCSKVEVNKRENKLLHQHEESKNSQETVSVMSNESDTINDSTPELNSLSHSGLSLSKTKEIRLESIRLISGQSNVKSKNSEESTSQFMLNQFLKKFSNITNLYISSAAEHVNLLDLSHIANVELVNTKFFTRGLTNRIESTGSNSQLVTRQKRLNLIWETPANDKGKEQNTIDFSSLNVDELQLCVYGISKYNVRCDQLPTGIQRLYLERVALANAESENVQWPFDNKSINLSSTNLPSTLKVLSVVGHNRAITFDLQFISTSMHTLRLDKNVRLLNQLSHHPLNLNKLILIEYDSNVFKAKTVESLLKCAMNVVIQFLENIHENLVLQTFPDNVKNVYASWWDNRSFVHVCYKKVDDGDSWSWKKEFITGEQFKEQLDEF